MEIETMAEKIHLESGQFGWDYIIESDSGQTVLIQSDWDYPGVASSFGWTACDCGETDGTVDCSHKTASEMIASAGEYLSENIGAAVDDPGYFSE
tara:strand:- start:996 stop:1280 length:285 start_codon:yes stop_codon:yes gene_type:complete